MKILIVEDDLVALYGLERILGREYEVDVENKAKNAIERVKRNDYDIVITDLKMPEISGIEILEKVKEISPKTEVIVITGYGTVENAVEAMKKGAKDYITKPFEPQNLIKIIEDIAEEKSFNLKKSEFKDIKREEIEKILEVLANQTRRKVLKILRQKKQSYSSIVKELEIKDPTKLNYHLKMLKNSNLISQNREKLYYLTPLGSMVVEKLLM